MFCTPKDVTACDFLTHFQAVEDPRQRAKVVYPPDEILLLVLCSVILGADGWTSIAFYGHEKLERKALSILFRRASIWELHIQLTILLTVSRRFRTF